MISVCPPSTIRPKALLSTTFFAILKSLYLIQRTNTIFQTVDRNIGSLFFVKLCQSSICGQIKDNKYGRTKFPVAFLASFWFRRKKLVHLSSVLLPWFHTKLFQTQTETFNPRKSKEMAYFKYSWSHGLAGLCLKVEQEQFPLLRKFLNIDKISYNFSTSPIWTQMMYVKLAH